MLWLQHMLDDLTCAANNRLWSCLEDMSTDFKLVMPELDSLGIPYMYVPSSQKWSRKSNFVWNGEMGFYGFGCHCAVLARSFLFSIRYTQPNSYFSRSKWSLPEMYGCTPFSPMWTQHNQCKGQSVVEAPATIQQRANHRFCTSMRRSWGMDADSDTPHPLPPISNCSIADPLDV